MYVLLLVMLLLMRSGSRASKCPLRWHFCSIWAAAGCGAVRPCSGSQFDGVAQRAPPRGRRIRVGVTCKMSWLMLHMLCLRVQFVGCLMHELLYMTLFMPARFLCKLFQTYVSQNIFPRIPISETFSSVSGY